MIRYFIKITAVVDDGAVFYINGVEVGRTNIAKGVVTSSTLAQSRLGTRTALEPKYLYADDSTIVNGENVVAVEVSQRCSRHFPPRS